MNWWLNIFVGLILPYAIAALALYVLLSCPPHYSAPDSMGYADVISEGTGQ